MKKKLYISLPISGRDLEVVKQRANYIKESVIADDYEGVTPFDICPDSTLPYSELMGRDIAGLMECDAVLFDFDWRESKGCRIEMAVARNCNIPVYKLADERVVEDADTRLFTITLNKRQLELLSEASDCHSRNTCGQLDAGLEEVIEKAIARTYSTADFNKRHEISEKVKSLLYEVKSLVWDLSPGTNKGVKYDDGADILFDIHQVIRHHLWKIKPEPKHHYTNDAAEATIFGSQPAITIKTLARNE